MPQNLQPLEQITDTNQALRKSHKKCENIDFLSLGSAAKPWREGFSLFPTFPFGILENEQESVCGVKLKHTQKGA